MAILEDIFWDVVGHPFCTLFILAITWIWVKVTYSEIDIKKYSLSMVECWDNRQYWRILTAPFMHSSLIHLLLNISCLWNLRYVEINYGTFFMIKYSIILSLSEVLIWSLIMKGFSNFVENSVLSEMLFRLQYSGTSGLVIAWLAFQSVEVMNEKTNAIFMLFGFLSIPSSFAPVILLGFYYLLTPRNNGVANSSGLFAGYLLGTGFLRIMDSTYWTICILSNVFLFFFITGKAKRVQSSLSNEGNARRHAYSDMHEQIAVVYFQDGRNREYLESVPFSDTRNDQVSRQTSSSRNNRELELRSFTNSSQNEDDIESKIGEDTKEEDSLEPLLSENGGVRNRDTYSSMGWSHVWPFRSANNTAGNSSGIGSDGQPVSRRNISPRRSGTSNIPHRLLVNEEDHV
jgi:membrane associated rhomboid family serine protease